MEDHKKMPFIQIVIEVEIEVVKLHFEVNTKARIVNIINMKVVATPLWPSVGVKPNTSKVGDLESSKTPFAECLELDRKDQNTSH
jgi:hypothetical protein